MGSPGTTAQTFSLGALLRYYVWMVVQAWAIARFSCPRCGHQLTRRSWLFRPTCCEHCNLQAGRNSVWQWLRTPIISSSVRIGMPFADGTNQDPCRYRDVRWQVDRGAIDKPELTSDITHENIERERHSSRRSMEM